MPATSSPGCLGSQGTARTLARHCSAATSHANVRPWSTDALLAARLAAGDDWALAEVFDRLAPAVHRAALRVLGGSTAAQDVVQDVFVELWCHPGRYDPGASSLRTYLIVLARHRAVDHMRSEIRRLARQDRCRRAAGLPASVPDPSTLRLMTELAAQLLPHAAARAGPHEPVTVHLVLTGPGGGTWDVMVGGASPEPATVSVVTDAVGFCRLVANRVTPADLDLHVTGDRGAAAWVLAAAPALALD